MQAERPALDQIGTVRLGHPVRLKPDTTYRGVVRPFGVASVASGVTFVASGFAFLASGFAFVASGFAFLASGFAFVASGFSRTVNSDAPSAAPTPQLFAL